MDTIDVVAELEQIAAKVRGCPLCPLAESRTKAVPGEGPPEAALMFIGEAPGYHEDRQGRPFVGASGKLLEELLASIGLSRKQVFITNIVKCRPPQNREPRPNEIEACNPYLDGQVKLIRPKVIATLGRFSMALFFPGESITRIHGQVKRAGDVAYVPLFHPAAALRNPQWMEAMKEDFGKLQVLLAELAPELPTTPPKPASGDGPQQLGLL